MLCQDNCYSSGANIVFFFLFLYVMFFLPDVRTGGLLSLLARQNLHASVSISSEGISWLFLQRLEFYFADVLIAFYFVFWRKDFSEFGMLLLRPQRLS